MPHVKRQSDVPYTTAQMYALVERVEDYAAFVPWCVKSEALSRTVTEVHGKLTFSASGIQKSFSTRNCLYPQDKITLSLLDGPFRHLEGFWTFESIDEVHSRVLLDLEFEFSSKLLAMMFGPVFEQVASSLVNAFTARAAQVYRA